jgi:hypothetical protein
VRGIEWSSDELKEFSNKMGELHDKGFVPFLFHLPGGNEEQLLKIFPKIKKGDYVLSTHRNIYHALLHDLPPKELEEKILNAKSMYIFDRERNFYMSAIIGGTVATAAGIALALKRKSSSQKVWCFIGDGTEDSGHFYEAARYVDGFDLPCTYIIEDDGMAVDASKESRWGTDKEFKWPSCVVRYHYTKNRPHARTGNFAPVDVMKSVMKTDEEYFPPLNQSYKLDVKPTKLSYKEAIKEAMTDLGAAGCTFHGYSIVPGDAMESLVDVPPSQKFETPVAENLMVGLAIGMSFEGFKPVVYFERHDFMLCAADAICNHMDKIERISHGEFKVPVILKTVVDDGGLFYSGPTHSQDFTKTFQEMVDFPVIDTHSPEEVIAAYKYAKNCNGPVMVVEHKKYL